MKQLGSHAVVTGGSSGLGEAYAQALAGRGLRVVLLARDEGRLKAAASRIGSAVPAAEIGTASVDVRDPAAVTAAFARIREDGGPVDVLVNSAGVLHEGHVDQIPLALFQEVLDVDYLGPLHTTLAALPDLTATGGRLVNVASVAGRGANRRRMRSPALP